MGFNRIELDPISPRFSRIELEPLATPKKRDTQRFARVGSIVLTVGSLAFPAVVRAEGESQVPPQGLVAPKDETPAVAGVAAEASADAEPVADSADTVIRIPESAVEVLPTRLFEPEYKITWPDGKSFTIINPEKGNKGFIINPDKEVQLPVRDPNTFIPIRDPEGNLIMRSSTVKDELKTAMDTHKVPRVILAPSKLLDIERPSAYFTVGGGTTTQQDKEPYMYLAVVVKPDVFLDAVVYAYHFNDTSHILDDKRYNDLFAEVGSSLAEGIYYFNSVPPNTIIRPKEGTPTDLGVMMYTLEITKPVEHIYQ